MNEVQRTVAESAPGFMPAHEGLALYNWACEVGPAGPILEIGTYCGKSTIYLAAAAQAHGRQVVTIDHHRGSEEHQPGWEYHDPTLVDDQVGLLDTVPTLRRVLHAAGVEDSVIAIIGSSLAVGSVWSTPVAMVFIDGGHTEQTALDDYRTWARHVQPGGLLAIHDVFPDPRDGGQAPWHIFERARRSGDFVEHGQVGSLRALRRR